jgi:hypothetical protein
MISSVPSRSFRLGAVAGPAFAVFFLGSVVASSPPTNNASDASWIANYTGHTHQLQHTLTGILLVLAALSLMTFLTAMWRRVAAARPDVSPLPLVAAGAACACIAAGGVVMASVSASELGGSYPLPGADVLRLANAAGFGLVALGGMWAAGLAVAVLCFQARAARVLGPRLAVFGQVAAGLLVLSLLFVPIIPLLIWAAVVGGSWLRPRGSSKPRSVATSARV